MEVRVGSLGEVRFPRGTYIYAGSALTSLEARVARHFRRGKKVHWHIDRLTARATPLEALLLRSQEDLECLLNEMVSRLDGARPLAPGFGCSDCRCATHLHLVGGRALARLEEFIPERMLPHR
jgi:sugar fermentation stimulation protein A